MHVTQDSIVQLKSLISTPIKNKGRILMLIEYLIDGSMCFVLLADGWLAGESLIVHGCKFEVDTANLRLSIHYYWKKALGV